MRGRQSSLSLSFIERAAAALFLRRGGGEAAVVLDAARLGHGCLDLLHVPRL